MDIKSFVIATFFMVAALCLLLVLVVMLYERFRYYRGLYGREKKVRKQYWKTILQNSKRITGLKSEIKVLESELTSYETLVELKDDEIHALEQKGVGLFIYPNVQAPSLRLTLDAHLRKEKQLQNELDNAKALIKLLENAEKEKLEQIEKLKKEYWCYRHEMCKGAPRLAAQADSQIFMCFDSSQVAEWVCEETIAREMPAGMTTPMDPAGCENSGNPSNDTVQSMNNSSRGVI